MLHGISFLCENLSEGNSQGSSVSVISRCVEQLSKQSNDGGQSTAVLWTNINQESLELVIKVPRKHGVELPLQGLQC
jgi:hypothetical protein